MVTIHGEFPGRKLEGVDRYKRLYHFTSFDTFVKIWLSKSLRFSSAKNVNDIQEAQNSVTIRNFYQTPLLHAFLEEMGKYKQISLSMDYDSYIWGCMSTMMWGHYGDKGNGVCLQFDYDKLNIPESCQHKPISYVDVRSKDVILDSELKTRRDIISFIEQNHVALFFTKTRSWENENEYRIISRELDSLDISEALSAVYLTRFDSDECIFVERLVDGSIPVKSLRFFSNKDNMAIPVLVDTCKIRKQFQKASKSPENTLNSMRSRSLDFYEQHKNDLDFPLIMNPLE